MIAAEGGSVVGGTAVCDGGMMEDGCNVLVPGSGRLRDGGTAIDVGRIWGCVNALVSCGGRGIRVVDVLVS